MFAVELAKAVRESIRRGGIGGGAGWGKRFSRHKRALKHSLAGEAFGLPGVCETTFRRPHPVIPRQVAPQQSLLLFHWTKSERFPFSFPWGSIGRETGNARLS